MNPVHLDILKLLAVSGPRSVKGTNNGNSLGALKRKGLVEPTGRFDEYNITRLGMAVLAKALREARLQSSIAPEA